MALPKSPKLMLFGVVRCTSIECKWTFPRPSLLWRLLRTRRDRASDFWFLPIYLSVVTLTLSRRAMENQILAVFVASHMWAGMSVSLHGTVHLSAPVDERAALDAHG